MLTLSLPRTDKKFEALSEENYIKINGQLFIIRTITEERTNDDMLIAHVECEHIFYELINEYKTNFEQSDATVQFLIDELLVGTRFSANTVSITGNYDLIVNRQSVIAALNQLLIATGGELKRDNFNITLLPQTGNDNGVQFRYRKNLRSIKRVVKSDNIVTRLYAYGKDDITIDPIDSSNINLYPRPKVAEIVFKDVTDTTTLQQMAIEYLSKHDTPYIYYEADVIELKNAVGYDDSESFGLGDTIHIYDEDLDLRVSARIVEYEYYPFEPEKSTVVLANFIPSVTDALSKLNETSNRVDRFTDSSGKVDTSWLSGKINTLKNQLVASGEYQTAEVFEDQGFLIENNNINSPTFGAVFIGCGIIALASNKLGNGEWNWRTMSSGNGVIADEINTGILRASYVRIESDGSAYIDGDGFHITDGTSEVIRMGEWETGKYGVVGYHTDGSKTILSGDGLLRLKGGVEKPYNYLSATGSAETGSTGNYFDTGGTRYANGTANGDGIPNIVITLPSDFQNKNFTVSVSVKSSAPYTMAIRDGDSYYAPYVDLGNYLDVVNVDTSAGTFEVKGYGSHYILESATSILWRKYWAIEFSYMVVA